MHMLTGDAGLRSCAGVGLKPQHVRDILACDSALGFVEIHAENYMGAGGPPHRHLQAVRSAFPLSIHGVGLSLCGEAALDPTHLKRLADLVARYEPFLVSEHLAWSTHGGAYLNDLLPTPYTRAALQRIVERIDAVQSAIGREILIENPSTYVEFYASSFDEPQFLREISRRSGCGLLLDVNNVIVSCANRRRDPEAYLSAFPLHRVKQFHLAGHAVERDEDGARLLIDSHDRPIAAEVWSAFALIVSETGPLPATIERDAAIPPWNELHAEAVHAHAILSAAPIRHLGRTA